MKIASHRRTVSALALIVGLAGCSSATAEAEEKDSSDSALTGPDSKASGACTSAASDADTRRSSQCVTPSGVCPLVTSSGDPYSAASGALCFCGKDPGKANPGPAANAPGSSPSSPCEGAAVNEDAGWGDRCQTPFGVCPLLTETGEAYSAPLGALCMCSKDVGRTSR